jgi:hypothetical protein
LGQKLAELRTTLELYRRTEITRALDLVRSDEAAALMGWIQAAGRGDAGARGTRVWRRETIQARRNFDAAMWIDVAALGGLVIPRTELVRDQPRHRTAEALEKALREQAVLQRTLRGHPRSRSAQPAERRVDGGPSLKQADLCRPLGANIRRVRHLGCETDDEAGRPAARPGARAPGRRNSR